MLLIQTSKRLLLFIASAGAQISTRILESKTRLSHAPEAMSTTIMQCGLA
jgi:hypothetical protein